MSERNQPLLALAPMQNVTDLPFMRVMQHYGGPDYYVTEYFRVHRDYTLEKHILRSITENETGRPIYAQMIGQDIDALVRIAGELERYPVAGIDLNLGCPAPVVCRKDAGGGLLRKPEKIRRILAALREAIDGKFTVKTRVGYNDADEMSDLLDVFSTSGIDLLTIHGRTVLERYQTPVHTDCIKLAVETMPCPVIANGNVVDTETGQAYLAQTNAAGLMIGRGAIRSPWLFSQLRAVWRGEKPKPTTRNELQEYILRLYEEVARFARNYEEGKHVNRMKKFMVYIAQGIDDEFENRIRRATTECEFREICGHFLTSDDIVPVLPPEKSKLFCGFQALRS